MTTDTTTETAFGPQVESQAWSDEQEVVAPTMLGPIIPEHHSWAHTWLRAGGIIVSAVAVIGLFVWVVLVLMVSHSGPPPTPTWRPPGTSALPTSSAAPAPTQTAGTPTPVPTVDTTDSTPLLPAEMLLDGRYTSTQTLNGKLIDTFAFTFTPCASNNCSSVTNDKYRPGDPAYAMAWLQNGNWVFTHTGDNAVCNDGTKALGVVSVTYTINAQTLRGKMSYAETRPVCGEEQPLTGTEDIVLVRQ